MSIRLRIPPAACAVICVALGALFLGGCKPKQPPPTMARQEQAKPLEITFAYGSEKERWIDDVTEAFNQGNFSTAGGSRIVVKAVPMASGEAMDEILSGRRQPDLVSPASSAFIELGNAESQRKYGRPLIGRTDSLVRSPLVIAMWKPMAESLGWGKKSIGWSDLLALARNPQGWKAYGNPQWGEFKFGHTRPQFSSSGLLTLLAEVYAAAGKNSGLTAADLRKRQLVDYLSAIEKSVSYRGSSTGFYGRLFLSDPQSLSAAALYENMVIESYSDGQLPYPIVAIYPKEGTLWSDHPVGIVEREWVNPERRAAAAIYIDYLLQRPQQEKAVLYGFRPALRDVPIGPPIDLAHGVNPRKPNPNLELPSVPVMESILDLWENGSVTRPGM
jgi:Ca-activated chloride channel family protein